MSLHQPVHNLDRLGFPHFLIFVHHLDTVGAVVLVHTHDTLLGAVRPIDPVLEHCQS